MTVLLAKAWEPGKHDPTGWWMSEKLDGVRALWTGREFISRLGNTFPVPEWFKAGLPEQPLDGELWMGRGQFQTAVSVIRSSTDKGWSNVLYRVFDAPDEPGGFEARQAALRRMVGQHPRAQVVEQMVCSGPAHLFQCLEFILAQGGEGVMLRKPGSLYERKRSGTLLKVKRFHDAEATVVGHSPGKGRHVGRLGALQCRMPSGVEFDCGAGFTDSQRESPPPVGALVTYRYQELTRDGVPRFPVYVATRDYE